MKFQEQLQLMKEKNLVQKNRFAELKELIDRAEEQAEFGTVIGLPKEIVEAQRNLISEARKEANELEMDLMFIDFFLDLLMSDDPFAELMLASILPDIVAGQEAAAL